MKLLNRDGTTAEIKLPRSRSNQHRSACETDHGSPTQFERAGRPIGRTTTGRGRQMGVSLWAGKRSGAPDAQVLGAAHKQTHAG